MERSKYSRDRHYNKYKPRRHNSRDSDKRRSRSRKHNKYISDGRRHKYRDSESHRRKYHRKVINVKVVQITIKIILS